MLSIFKKEECKQQELAKEALNDRHRAEYIEQAAKHLQKYFDNDCTIYDDLAKINAIHQSLTMLKSYYSLKELREGLWLYGPYHYKFDGLQYKIHKIGE